MRVILYIFPGINISVLLHYACNDPWNALSPSLTLGLFQVIQGTSFNAGIRRAWLNSAGI